MPKSLASTRAIARQKISRARAGHAISTRTARKPRAPATPPAPEVNEVRVSRDGEFRCGPEAVAWRCARVKGDRRLRLSSPAGDGVELTEWPLEELSADALRDRWGPGKYSVTFLRAKGAKTRPCGRHELVVTRKANEPAPAPAPSPPQVSESIGALRDVLDLVNVQAKGSLEHVREETRRSIEREREYNRRDLEQQRMLFEHMMKLATPQQPQQVPQGEQVTRRDVIRIVKKVSRAVAKQYADDDPGFDGPEEPRLMPALLEWFRPLTPGLNQFLSQVGPAAAAWIASRTAVPGAPVLVEQPTAVGAPANGVVHPPGEPEDRAARYR